MFEQAFQNIDGVLWEDAGCTTELDYIEHTKWRLYFQYLDGLEPDKSMEAELEGKKYTHVIAAPHRWDVWVAPRGAVDKLDPNNAHTGDALRDGTGQRSENWLNHLRRGLGQFAQTIPRKLQPEHCARLPRRVLSRYWRQNRRALFRDRRTGKKRLVLQSKSGRIIGATSPLNDTELAELIALQKTLADSGKSWSVDTASTEVPTNELSVKNPRPDPFEVAHSTCKLTTTVIALTPERLQFRFQRHPQSEFVEPQ